MGNGKRGKEWMRWRKVPGERGGGRQEERSNGNEKRGILDNSKQRGICVYIVRMW